MPFIVEEHQKLVRSKVIGRIKANGQTPKWRTITHTPTFLGMLLNKKLPEEVEELRKAKTEKQVLMEAADVLQVIYDYAEKKGISPKRLDSMRRARFRDRGGFDGTYLESVKIPNGQR